MARRKGSLDDQDRAEHAEKMADAPANTDERKDVARERADSIPPDQHPERDILSSESAAPHELHAAQNRHPGV